MSRGGAKKRPFYRIVVADSRAPRDGRFIEKLGFYNPLLPKEHAERLVIKEERVKYWLSVGALPSDRVARFLGLSGVAPAPAVPTDQPKKSAPKAKAQERAAAKAKAAAEAAEAAPAEA
jgi:small subunit ribosomal protein S16